MNKEIPEFTGTEEKARYEQLIALLEESNDIQDKTIQVLKKQVEVLKDMLAAAER